MVAPRRSDTCDKILAAAETLARQVGPGNISLEAVAAQAGVSKGGLLYHFPSKDRLLRALVERFVGQLDEATKSAEGKGTPNGLMAAYVRHVMQERAACMPPPTGLLAALAEHPDMLDPVRDYERDFLARVRKDTPDPRMAVVAFLVVHAVRSMELLDINVLTDDEIESTLAWVLDQLEKR
jgi:AcrR family transcriptional regulator